MAGTIVPAINISLFVILFSLHMRFHWCAVTHGIKHALNVVTHIVKFTAHRESSAQFSNGQIGNRWREFKIQHATRAYTLVMHVFGFVLLISLCGRCLREVSPKWHGGVGADMKFSADLSICGCIVLYGGIMVPLMMPTHMTTWSFDLLGSAVLLIMHVKPQFTTNDVSFFNLAGGRVCLRLIIALIQLDSRVVGLTNVLVSSLSVASYSRHQGVFRADIQEALQGLHTFFIIEIGISLMIVVVSYAVGEWVKERLQAILVSESAQRALESMLLATFDTVARLDSNLCLTRPSQKLLHTLVPGRLVDASEFEGCSFIDLIELPDERLRFSSFINSSASQADAVEHQECIPARVIRVEVYPSKEMRVPIEIFHTCLSIDDSSRRTHFLGIRTLINDMEATLSIGPSSGVDCDAVSQDTFATGTAASQPESSEWLSPTQCLSALTSVEKVSLEVDSATRTFVVCKCDCVPLMSLCQLMSLQPCMTEAGFASLETWVTTEANAAPPEAAYYESATRHGAVRVCFGQVLGSKLVEFCAAGVALTIEDSTSDVDEAEALRVPVILTFIDVKWSVRDLRPISSQVRSCKSAILDDIAEEEVTPEDSVSNCNRQRPRAVAKIKRLAARSVVSA